MAGRLILLSLPFTSWSLGGLPLIMRWTGYIWLRRHPTGTPQVPSTLKDAGSRYFWPLKLTDVANEAGQERRCEGWSYVINPPGSEIQVIVQMEPMRHHNTRDLPEVDISSLHPSDSLLKGSCLMVGHAFSDRSRWVSYARRHQTESAN